MDKQLAMLIDLQKIDLAQEALRMDVDKKRAKVEADSDLLADLGMTLEKQTAELDDSKALLNNKMTELSCAQKGHDHANDKLNAVTNSRDYAALEREVENFKRIITQLEEEIAKLKESVDEAEEANAKHKAEYDALNASIEANQSEVDAAAAAIEERVAQLQAQSNELAKSIQPQILARYRFIRSRRPGEAVVSASGGTCTGCHMRLQPQAFIVLQRQNSLECRQNCQRILYFSAEEAQALHSAK